MSTNLTTKRSKNGNYLSMLINSLYYGIKNSEEQALDEFFLSLHRAQQEMYDAENFFNNVVDPELVDHAIYKMEAAKTKYVYLLKQAKDNGIRIEI
ncbi:MAG: hypothetical protein K0R80_2417 [Clostridia bacterium]|jgi:hypothetical protein|nr:hypothetical protein [Clostridia bacterium]